MTMERLWAWRDPGLARSLRWYAAVAANRKPAKFRIAAAVPASLPLAEAAEPALWKELERLTPVFLSSWGGLRSRPPEQQPARSLPGARLADAWPLQFLPRLPRLCQGGAALPSSRYPRRQAALRGLVYAREQRGISQERQRAFHRAVQSWEAAAGICRTAGMTPQLRTNLGHLLRGYRAQGRLADVDRVESELRQLKAEERSR